jgi:hypothetical protein
MSLAESCNVLGKVHLSKPIIDVMEMQRAFFSHEPSTKLGVAPSATRHRDGQTDRQQASHMAACTTQNYWHTCQTHQSWER